jgi:hypothetical protein
MYETYLVELLTLFADKGVAIQNVAISVQSVKVVDIYSDRHEFRLIFFDPIG